MREYLFRGKRRDTGEWVEGDLRHGGYYLNDPDVYICVRFADTIINYPVDPESIGQYTGLTDKNGRKIFEGDVLFLRTSRAHEVKYADGSFFMEGTAVPIRYAEKFEIIGTIHDNPELLKEDGNEAL